MEVNKEQVLTKSQRFLRKKKFEIEIDYTCSRSTLTHKGAMVWQKEWSSCKSLDALKYEKWCNTCQWCKGSLLGKERVCNLLFNVSFQYLGA